MARNRGKQDTVPTTPKESTDLIRTGTNCLKRTIIATPEQFFMLTAVIQQSGDNRKLEPPILPQIQILLHGAEPVAGEFCVDLVQQTGAQRVIDRAAVVRIDQAQIPQLRTL